jgi:hypothetical protein
MKADLSSSDSMYQYSDYVIVIHRPELLNINFYGPNSIPTKDKVFLHILKVRDAGEPCIIQYQNDLAHNNIIEL